MRRAGGRRHRYTAASARLYGSIGIEGTTYQIGFDAVRELLGDISGQTFLDFGCGTGRSTAFLQALGAGQVYGLDHDRHMLDAARARRTGRAAFLLSADGAIPLPDVSVDGAVSLNVFVELRTPDQILQVCGEVARVLRPGGQFIVESTSPMAFGHVFRSYRYPQAEGLRSGSRTPCIVTTAEGQIVIEDTYWTEDDYARALTQAGLTITAISYPRPADPSAWSTDEATVSPCIILQAAKPR